MLFNSVGRDQTTRTRRRNGDKCCGASRADQVWPLSSNPRSSGRPPWHTPQFHGAWEVGAPNDFLTIVSAVNEGTGERENCEPRKQAQVRRVDAIPEELVETTVSV